MKLLSSLALIPLLAAFALAQAPPGLPAAPQPGAQGAVFFQPKMTGTELGAYYFAQTGKRVIVDPQAALIEVNITILQAADNNKEAQISAVEKAAALNNLAFIPSGPNEVKLLVVASGEKGNAVPLVVDADDLPEGDNLVTYVMQLSYLRPEEAQRLFTQMTALHPYGSITIVENASALIIKESSSLIRMFLELKDQVDVPSDTLKSEWFDLVNADAEIVAEKLNTISQAQREEQSSARSARAGSGNQPTGNANRPPGVPPAAGGANAAGSGGVGSGAKTIITTDERQNSILLIGPPSELLFLGDLIERFDAPTTGDGFFTRKLRFLTVIDFLDVAENALSRVEVGVDGQSGAGNRTGGNRRNTARNNTRGTNANNNNANGGGAGGSQLSDPGETGAPESLLVGKTFLVADTITNTIVVQGPPQSVKIIDSLLDKIDKAGPQVVISTVFGQFTRNNSNEFGFDWIKSMGEAGQNGDFAGSVRNSSSSLPSDVRPVDGLTNDLIGSQGGPFNLAGLSLYGQIGSSWNGYLRAAAARGDFTVLSRPTIYTKNNTRAVISSGTRIAVPTSTINQAVGGAGGLAQNTNIEYRDVELRLEVVPLVNSDEEVTLEISQLNDQVIDDNQQVNGLAVPTIAKQELLTTVTVKNRKTIVLGGLITREVTDNRSGIPILSDIPGLGALFSTTRKAEVTRELLIFIQPEIVTREEDIDQSQLELNALYEVDDSLLQFNEPFAPPVEPGDVADQRRGARQAKPIRRNPSNWARRVIRHR